MASDGEGVEDAVGEAAAAEPQNAPEEQGGVSDEAAAWGDEPEEPTPFFVELWNDYDPSMRFVAIFPVGEDQGATASSAAYYIIEPGSHTGLHNDNAEEVVFVAEGEGEVFVMGSTTKLEAGKFVVFPQGMDHDIYAHGATALRLLSFFPTTEIISTFQQVIYPVASNELSSKPPKPVVRELDPSNLPEDFPFSLEELGITAAEPEEPREPSTVQRLIAGPEPEIITEETKGTKE